MNDKYVYISGSAGASCPREKLDVASRFVRSFTGEVLDCGGGIVVLAADEPGEGEAQSAPSVFDWVALREAERYAGSTTESPRPYARVVMSDKAPESKIGDDNLRLLANLQQRNVVEIRRIRRELFTGGEYRGVMMEQSDAMVAVGGGKGTYTAGTGMIKHGKPVLPLDLQLGSSLDDGDGAVSLHREMLSEPSRFFPGTHQGVRNRVDLLALDRGINQPESVARVAVEMLARELKATASGEQSANVRGRLAVVWRAVKELSVVAAIIRIFESAKGVLSSIW